MAAGATRPANRLGEQLREAYRRQEHQRLIVRLLSGDLEQTLRILPDSRNGPALGFSIQDGGILIPELNATLDRPPTAFPEAPTSESDRRLQARWREARQRDSDGPLRQLAGRDSPFAALALTMSTAVEQPGRGGGKPPGQDKDKDKSTESAVFGEAPDGTAGDVCSNEWAVPVGTDVQTYSPDLIELYLSEELVTDPESNEQLIAPGSKPGMARVLRKNAREGGRLDFYFDCSTTDLDSCDYRLIVRFGIYDGKVDTVWFDLAEMTLNQRPKEDTPGKTLKTGEASFSVKFVE